MVPDCSEQHFYFTNRRGRRLYAVLHRPTAAPRSAWVFCNPYFEEATFAHRAFVLAARTLSSDGHAVLRFDFEGDGDSEGELPYIRRGDRVSDLVDAAHFLREQVGDLPLAVFALRAGALPAAASAPHVGAQWLHLWEPVLDGAAHFQEHLRANLTTQLAVHKRILHDREEMMAKLRKGSAINFSGHDIGAETVDELRSWKLAELLGTWSGHVDLVHLSRKRDGDPPATWTVFGSRSDLCCFVAASTAIWMQSAAYEDVPEDPLHRLREAANGLTAVPHS